MVIQKRDQEILRVCYEQQFLTTEHVIQYFFKVGQWRRAYERISELKSGGFLRAEKNVLFDQLQILRLTSYGQRLVLSSAPIEVPQVRRLDPRTLVHDTIVTSVRLRLSDFWDGSWIPERVIKQDEYPQIPDGLFVFQSGKKVAVEVENSPKDRARFFQNMERWRKTDVKLVLFIATTPALVARIEGYLKEGPQGLPLALVFWDELKKRAVKVWTPSGSVDVFNRKEY